MEAQEFDIALTELETRVDRLRALYENWFRGYEKSEPQVARKDVERRVYALRKELPRNTALRFRYHQLYQRFTTLATYWQRTARQVEEGTYRLQLQRLRRKRADDTEPRLSPPRGEEDAAPRERAYALDLDETLDVSKLLDDFDLDEVGRALEGPSVKPAPKPEPAAAPNARFARPSLAFEGEVTSTRELPPQPRAESPARVAAPSPPALHPFASSPKPAAARPPAPPPAAPKPAQGEHPPASKGRPPPPPPPSAPRVPPPPPSAARAELGEQRMRRLYDEYAAARRKNNEGEVRFETLASSIEKMLPDLRKRHQGKQIDFEVVLKDGRVGLRPKAV